MGKAVSKDGWITNLVEAIPFGGMFTAPFHAFAGNEQHAVKAVVGGLSSGAAAVTGLGALGSAAVGALASGIVNIPFTYVNKTKTESGQFLKMASCSRHLNRSLTEFISTRAMVFKNRWGYALSVDDEGHLSHHNTNACRDGWEGWVIEHCGGSNAFISRNKGNGYRVMAISDEGYVQTTPNRDGWEMFEVKFHPSHGVMTFQRVKEPRWFLACNREGEITSTKSCDLEGWEAWIPQ